MATFKETNKECRIDKTLKKSGLSVAVIFSKEDCARFNLSYGDTIRLDNAEIIKSTKDCKKQ